MYEAIVKYIIQGPECVQQGFNPIYAKFHIMMTLPKEEMMAKPWAVVKGEATCVKYVENQGVVAQSYDLRWGTAFSPLGSNDRQFDNLQRN